MITSLSHHITNRIGDNLHKQDAGQDSETTTENMTKAKAFGQLVQLGFDVAVFTPAAYQRGSLPRPSMESSS